MASGVHSDVADDGPLRFWSVVLSILDTSSISPSAWLEQALNYSTWSLKVHDA